MMKDVMEASQFAQEYIGKEHWTRAMQYDFCHAYERMNDFYDEFTRKDAIIIAEMCYMTDFRHLEHMRCNHKKVKQ
jgi:hypothetical protein